MSEDLAEELERNIPLSEMIQTLRQELRVAIARTPDPDLKFRVEKVELELEVLITAENKGGLKAKFWVVTAEGAKTTGARLAHKFKLTLIPEAAGGGPLHVNDESQREPS